MKKSIIILGLVAYTSTFSNPSINSDQASVWQDVKEEQQQQFKRTKPDNLLKRRSLSLDEETLKRQLVDLLLTEIDLPLPKGDFVRVKVIESPIFSSELAQNYPEIKTWRVVGVDDPSITGRIDFTSQGFHGMLVLADGETVYIDPDKNSQTNLYHSLAKSENKAHFKTDFDCKVHNDHALFPNQEDKPILGKKLALTPAPNLITYRLALAGTAEYTATQGGTKASAYASMVTTINRVNQIYQRDLGIKLELVSGEQLIYTNVSTDPYTDNSKSDLVNENMANLLSNFGENKYDLGHVFSKGAYGGLAYIGVACLGTVEDSSGAVLHGVKGGGTTGIPNPQGETFSIDFVAHEIGHQLGADHTFNGTGGACGDGRNADTAVETGSGSTIMGYSGLCGIDDIQTGADAMFHQVSMNQISFYTRNDYGKDCGVRTSTGNQNPVANAGEDIRIPRLTPFVLEGSATGGSTYAWDQMDAGKATHVDVDLGNNAIIRSELPSSSSKRFIPRLTDLFGSTTRKGEKLPSTSRSLKFAFVVRDGNGGVGSDYKNISVVDTGRGQFRVKSQSTDSIYSTGQTVDVKWFVAGTDDAPISCSSVDIKLIRESGEENTLLLKTVNDGAETIIIPAVTPNMTKARIMIACSTRSFFQLSSGEITIQQGSINSTIPIDKIAPKVTLIGDSVFRMEQYSDYAELGATATDNVDAVVSVSITGSVDTSKVGSYTIVYTAKDKAGNISTENRTVIVAAKQEDNGGKSSGKSGGGSIGFILLPLLALIGIRRRALKLKK